MDPQKVFQDFLNLCSDHAGHLQYQLANNAVLEWFGRTIKGKEKIKNFVRFELSHEYEHQFNNWNFVDPFEVRPSHFETKTLSLERLPVEGTAEKRNHINDATPQESKIKIVELPELRQGRKFLPHIDSDDEDLKDLGLTKIVDTTPPNPSYSINTVIHEEPPFKKLKIVKLRNLFSTKEKNNEPLDISGAIELTKYDINFRDTQTDLSQVSNPQNSSYSDLHYIESTGCLITANRLKYPGVQPLPIGETSFQNEKGKGRFATSACSYNTPCSSFLEREVKLKISYRIRRDNNQIEFALIIYEHAVKKASTRRNLLLEFKQAADMEEKNMNVTSTIKSKKKNVEVKIKRKTPLKSLMRLF